MSLSVHTLPSQSHAKRGSLRYRLAIASRALAAIAGGYAVAAGTNVALTLALKNTGPKEDVIMLATMPSFLVWAGAVIWVFTARTAVRAWLGVAVPGVVVAMVIWFLRSGGSAS
ncbi:MAG: hypothetical protein QM760_05445 [Nibricoccus sp.]